MSTNSAKSSSKPPKVAIGDVMSSIKRTETKGGRGSIWSHRTFLGARKSLVHWCAVVCLRVCVLVLMLVFVAGVLVLAHRSTELVHKMQRANGAHNTIG